MYSSLHFKNLFCGLKKIHFNCIFQIINAYFSLITKANPLVGALDAFFFVDVVMKKDLSKWLKPELFDKHMLFIPAIYRNHWRLVVIVICIM